MGLFINTQDTFLGEDVCCLGVSPHLLDILSEYMEDIKVLDSLSLDANISLSESKVLTESDKTFGQKFKETLSKAREKIMDFFKKLMDMMISAFRSVIAFFRNIFKKKETELTTDEKKTFTQTKEDLDKAAREKFKKEGFVVFFYKAEAPEEMLNLSAQLISLYKNFLDGINSGKPTTSSDELVESIGKIIAVCNTIVPGQDNSGGVRTNITLEKFDKGMNDRIRDIIEVRRNITNIRKKTREDISSPEEQDSYEDLCKVARNMQLGHEALARAFHLFMHIEQKSMNSQKEEGGSAA